MKDIARQQMSMKVESMDMLNAQIQMEGRASASYLAMASWCDQRGYTRSAEFLYRQSAEEREHMMKIFKFVNDCGGNALSPEIKNIEHDFTSLEEIFETALAQEIEVTRSINNIIAFARKNNDFGVENFLQWFVSEQLEEEKNMRDILDLFELMGREGVALKLIDERIPVE